MLPRTPRRRLVLLVVPLWALVLVAAHARAEPIPSPEQFFGFRMGADGKLAGGAIHKLFDGIDKDFRPSPEAQSAIVRIEIVGTAASARIDTNDVSGFCFTDFFHLLKVEGKWTVVSKIFHTHIAP
jgi:hypothetical protein